MLRHRAHLLLKQVVTLSVTLLLVPDATRYNSSSEKHKPQSPFLSTFRRSKSVIRLGVRSLHGRHFRQETMCFQPKTRHDFTCLGACTWRRSLFGHLRFLHHNPQSPRLFVHLSDKFFEPEPGNEGNPFVLPSPPTTKNLPGTSGLPAGAATTPPCRRSLFIFFVCTSLEAHKQENVAISVFGKMSKHIVLTQILTSLCSRLQRSFVTRTGMRASL